MKTLAFVLALAVAACNSDLAAKPATTKVTLTDLSKSLDAVRAEFNTHTQEARFLTLLAPT
ncbi:MAG: hypothetical protein ABIY55_34510 [Kofleriaceae bacterium]